MRNSILLGAGLLVLIAGGLSVWVYPDLFSSPSASNNRPRPTLVSAQRAFSNGDFQSSLTIATELLESDPNSPRAALLAGESATKLGNLDQALEFYSQIPDSANEAPVARWASGEILFFEGRVSDARESLQRCLELDPNQLNAHQRLVDVGSAIGLRREVQPNILKIVRSGQVQANLLLLLGNMQKDTWTDESLNRFRKVAPSDPLPDLGFARINIKNGKYSDAIAQLRSLISKMPELIEAHVQLGYALLEHEPDQLHRWNAALPAKAEEHPGTWYVRGQWLRRLGKSQSNAPEQAIRCFVEAIRCDPNHLPAHQTVAQLLKAKGQKEIARNFAERAEKLQKVNIALEQVYLRRGDTELMREIADLCCDLGRIWECIGWCGVARSIAPELQWPDSMAGNMIQGIELSAKTPQTLVSANLAMDNQLDAYSLPDFSALAATHSVDQRESDDTGKGQLFVEDRSDEVGLDFTYICNNLEVNDGRRMHEITGGGVGIIDFNNDGMQDIFLTQGGVFPVKDSDKTHNNVHQDFLYRCESQETDSDSLPKLARVDALARIVDFDYGQGVAIGDINSDGFDDVFVCNIGQNNLWINCGDGTFLDGRSSLPADTTWSVSAAIADLNNDGSPEIYEANYVQGDDVYTKKCEMAGKLRSCSPLSFSPTDDRILFNDAHGRFQLLDAPDMNAPSLGVLLFRMTGEETPSIFVAVDQAANLLGKVDVEQSSGDVPFSVYDEALVSGIAYDTAGEAQACMGVAAGDVNNDGAIDLYVSNFYLEYYTLYLQDAGLFNDATSGSGTIADTRPLLGFGTQFFDADLDGNEDLLVVNGHIDDHSHVGVPEKMPSLLYSGNGRGQFALQPPRGDFLARRQLGRALTKVDLDRDGMVDMICGDLEERTSYVRNESQTTGRAFTIQLVGTESDRNAFFSQVELIVEPADGKTYTRTKQLVSGSGFQASNQRCLNFAVPDSIGDISCIRIKIDWASGISEEHLLDDIPGEYLAVEKQDITLLHRYSLASAD